MNYTKYYFNQLLTTLIVLSSNSEMQLKAYGIGNVEEELAIDLDYLIKDYKEAFLEEDYLNSAQVKLIEKLNNVFDIKSEDNDTDFWIGIEFHQDWELIRSQSKTILQELGKENLTLDINVKNKYSFFRKKIISQNIQINLINRV